MALFSSDFIDRATMQRYDAAGFGRPVGMGSKPALLIIDVQYRTTGTTPLPFEKAIQEFSTSVGEVAWQAVDKIAELLEVFRSNEWPVLYPHVAPKTSFDQGALGAKVPTIMNIASHGYDFVDDIAPREGDILLPKKHPSAFFGTPLASYLIQTGADSLVVVGCSTSGCVRSTVIDAFSYNYKVSVPSDAVYDRSQVIHDVNLFDLDQKYADVNTTENIIQTLGRIKGAR
ncbi:isochorismatase family protein [Brevibacterium aurantiacum]|uniref:Nicotinamidase-related amidase n=1 Tax=Brevibacterium aurantiacum TaxID=273384 RepID=A0A2H1KMN7_BREAU|nr:isochorismatase family protein [Brevibacterium aurantiacum]SMY01007.1 Nicotinamidase-related amidase [Brevibacterium aurantiacum]